MSRRGRLIHPEMQGRSFSTDEIYTKTLIFKKLQKNLHFLYLCKNVVYRNIGPNLRRLILDTSHFVAFIGGTFSLYDIIWYKSVLCKA
jgi:hypothetical protein